MTLQSLLVFLPRALAPIPARGISTSVNYLARRLMRYIRQYNQAPKPAKWKYFDVTKRITPSSVGTVH